MYRRLTHFGWKRLHRKDHTWSYTHICWSTILLSPVSSHPESSSTNSHRLWHKPSNARCWHLAPQELVSQETEISTIILGSRVTYGSSLSYAYGIESWLHNMSNHICSILLHIITMIYITIIIIVIDFNRKPYTLYIKHRHIKRPK